MTDGVARDEAREREVRRYGVIGIPQPELDDLAQLATELCHVPAAAINLMESGTQATIAAVGTEVGVCARRDSMCNAIIDEQHPVLVPDASVDPRWRDNPFVNGERNKFRFYCAHHLVSPRGVVIGTMCIFDYEPRELPEEDDFQLSQLAQRVVDFLELRLRTRELEETVDELTLARRELERSNEMLRLFAAQVAHDLRGPIAAVNASLQLMRDSHEPETEESWLVDRAAGSIARMNELIRDMLAFASVGGHPDQDEVDLEALVDELRDDLAAELQGVTLEAGLLPVVRGDRTQWRVVLQNLISNAVKFNDTDHPWVGISASVDAEEWVLEVADNGPGVPEEDRTRVFGLMSQGDPTGDGIGLGLATCWRIVRAHRGVIVMGAAEPRGARVLVRVPWPGRSGP